MERKVRNYNKNSGFQKGEHPWNYRLKGYDKGFQKGHKINLGRKGAKGNHPKTEFKKGHSPWNKGKHTGLSYWLGKKRPYPSIETRKKMSKSNIGRKKSPRSEEHQLKLTKIRSKQIMPMKDTLIEVKIQEFLSKLHIEFFTHKYISEIEHSYRCDILIPAQKGVPVKTVIECDGCYWHGCPICNLRKARKNKYDIVRTKELQQKGFRVIRLWGHEIKTMGFKELKNRIGEKQIGT